MEELLHGTDLFGEAVKPKASGIVAERFVFPPFTVLDTKQGEWRERKRKWLSIGITGELGRGAQLLGSGTNNIENQMALASKYGIAEEDMVNGCGVYTNATSVFDPVVCELAYKWFSPEGGQIVDPFAGGSVRGVVAKTLGRKYWGCDLREEQIKANIAQAEEILEGFEGHSAELFKDQPDLQWVCGDSAVEIDNAPLADFVFSCPPYGDLEVYSEDVNDLSNMDYADFLLAYNEIIHGTVTRMKPDTFACFVVGDFRDKKGFYRNFVSHTIAAFEAAGARLYNEAILCTSVGSAALRVTKQFNAGRKLCKTHQNILVFCKGDWKKAAMKCLPEQTESPPGDAPQPPAPTE